MPHHLKGVSRTYALVIPMLPDALARSVGLAYLLMRIVDTLEDSPELDDAQRDAWLEALDQRIAAKDSAALSSAPADCCDPLPEIGDNAAERQLMRDAPEVLRRVGELPAADRAAAVDCARRMIGGVRMMLNRSRIRGLAYPGNVSQRELRSYCYYVAGVVGEMLYAMFTRHLGVPYLAPVRGLAIELGVGLQLVNILKDAWKDAGQNRRYLPPDPTGSVGQVSRAVLAEARSCLARGVEFVLQLPATARGVRSFCGLPLAWGALTLARAERRGSGAKIGRAVIQSSVRRFQRLVDDDSALRAWFERLIPPSPRTVDRSTA